MRALLILLCACTTLPTGTIYQCEGVFTCYGDHFGLTPAHGCADSLDEAGELFYAHALELTKEAKCGDSWEITYTCKDTGDICTLED